MSTSKIRIALAVLAAAASATAFGASAAPAEAAVGPMSAKLTINRAGPGYYGIKVTGVVKASPAEARNMAAKNYRFVWRMWGDDTFSDDLLFGPDPASLNVTSQGLEFEGQRVVKASVLNEDWGRDEVYAGVRLLTTYGSTMISRETNQYWYSF